MPWLKHRLRDADVWAKVDDAGALVTDRDGRVEIVYKPADGARVYRAGARNLARASDAAPVDIVVGEAAPVKTTAPAPSPGTKPASGKARVSEANAAAHAEAEVAKAPADAIQVWTDGACAPNPGPSGLGVVILDGEKRTEISEYLGPGTNITAEMTAILRALQRVEDRTRPVVVYTDSEFSINMLTKVPPWKPKKNVELVAEVRAMCKRFSNLRFVWVRGHANVPLNVRCDELATEAVARRR